MTALFYSLYNGATFFASLAAAPVFLCFERGRAKLAERFGAWNLPAGEVIWLHGASVGEVNGLLPLIPRLRARFPGEKILLTATSVTGLDRAASHVDFVRLLPFDSTVWFRRAVRNLTVRFVLFGETELWPVFISENARRGTKLFLVNARISDYSWRWYRALRPAVRSLLAPLHAVMCADPVSADRYGELTPNGVPVVTVGNAKYDFEPSVRTGEAARALRARFFAGDAPLLVLGSIRPGEEEVWFAPLREALDRGAAFQVIVAPRHRERFEYFASALERSGISFSRWSALERDRSVSPHRVVLLDTMGMLEPVYSCASAAFIGGSVVDEGGHNPLEAAAYGAAIAMGRFRRNVREIARQLDDASALMTIESPADAARVLALLETDRAALAASGARAKEIWQAQRGATERIIGRITS